MVAPSAGHGRRMIKILRSESRRQVRHFKECLKVACSSASGGLFNVKAFRDWCRQANIVTEAIWNDVRRKLPKKKKREVPEGRLLILGVQRWKNGISRFSSWAKVLRGTKDRHRRQVSTYKGHCQECTRERKRSMCGGMCGRGS